VSKNDRDLGMNRAIPRRDFLNGVSIAVGAALTRGGFPGLEWIADGPEEQFPQDKPGYYPPALTGMRGSHDGSFESAHLLRDGDFWKNNPHSTSTGETFDLVVVGGGISGLAAAYFYRKNNTSAKILILDNHDDFGGHAKRNEFHHRERMLLANGGTVAIESPLPYSKEAHGLLSELGIDPAALEAKCLDREVYKGLKASVFFNKETFGADRLVVGLPAGRLAPQGAANATSWAEFVAKTQLPEAVQRDIVRVQEGKVDYLPGLSSDEKKDRLSRMSYKDFLLKVVKVDPGVIPFYQTRTHGLYGVGIDAVSALDCWGIGFPGFQGLSLAPGPYRRMGFTAMGEATPDKEPYHFHFPDGNASIARMLVRAMIPNAAAGHTPEDIVTAQVDYSRLDKSDSPVRIRLSSTAVRATHAGDPASAKEVHVSYTRAKQIFTVRAKHAVLACWNMVIPYLCPELPEKQKEALKYGTKVPLVYSVVAVRDWKPFRELGVRQVSSPGMYHTGVSLDQPISIGDYKCSQSPEDPILLRMTRTPCMPGLSERDQHKAGRGELLSASFETFERNIRDQLSRILAPGGFDPARDIEAITVNRWPHGYAYEYNPLWDPDWPEGQRPCDIARARFGNITIANSDAAAAAYTDQAIDQAFRAVSELTSV
jgi:spermidine dehydrogenase